MQCFDKERQSLFTIEKKKPNCDLNLVGSRKPKTSRHLLLHGFMKSRVTTLSMVSICICGLFKLNIITKKNSPLVRELEEIVEDNWVKGQLWRSIWLYSKSYLILEKLNQGRHLCRELLQVITPNYTFIILFVFLNST